jgi:hypothetical protein
MINKDYRAIFVHNPKCGGTSLINILKQHGFSHNRSYGKDSLDPNEGRFGKIEKSYGNKIISTYFLFTFVRNPYDRMVSSYHYLNKRLNGKHIPLGVFKNFNDFVKNLFSISDHHWKWHYTLQHTHIQSKHRKCDFIGRFENLQEDFNIVCDKIGIPHQQLPHKNKSKHKHYTEYYDDETKSIVAEKYAKDIEYFGYKFGE